MVSPAWDSSCEKSWVPVHNQWVPVQKTMNPQLKMLGPLCNQAFNLTPKLCILQFTEIKIYSLYCKAQQRLKEICVVKQKPREQPHKSHEQYILQKRHLMVDRSIFASYAEAYELFCFPGDFYQSGTPDTEVTKSLHGDYGIKGKFASEWRDWRTLKGTLVRDLIEKRNVEKALFLIGTTTANTTPRPPVIVGQVCKDNSGHENHCSYWAKTGQCDKNPDWMLVNCKKSCSSKIKDSNPSCPAWAKLRECTKNPSWMLPNCKLSCMRIKC